jgi:fatty acyl-CoA reductase
LGKVLIEKLLRVTEVGKIYLLIRSKKGVNPKDRVLKMIEDPVSYKNIAKL